MDGRVGAKAEPGFGFVGAQRNRDQQSLAGGRKVDVSNGGREGTAAVFGKSLALELRLHEAAELGERNVNWYSNGEAPLLHLLDNIELRRERTIGLGLVRNDARF